MDLQFHSPEGQLLEERVLPQTLIPHFQVVDDGYFVSKRDFEFGQLTYRFGADGAIESSDTLDIGECFYSFVMNGMPQLLSLQFDIVSDHWRVRTVVYRFDQNAALTDSTLLREFELEPGENNAGYTFHYDHGVLTIVSGSVTPGAPLNEFRVWLTTYDGESTYAAEPWDPGPLPPEAYVTMWGIVRRANGQFVLAAFVRNDLVKKIWFMGLESDGVFNSNIHIQETDTTRTLNGLQLAEIAGSVVYSFTEITLDGSLGGGAQVAAFPMDWLLNAPDASPSLPNDLAISVAPNPFNAQATLTFTIDRDRKSVV